MYRPPGLRWSLAAAWAAAVLTVSAAVVRAGPLPPGVHPSRPCAGPSADHAQWGRYVDLFATAEYEIDLGSHHGQLSKLVRLRYDDGTTLYVDIDDIHDRTLDPGAVSRASFEGTVCDGGRIFPRELGRSLTPRLWSARAEILRLQEEHNAEFIVGHAFPAVFTIAVAQSMPGALPPRASRRPLPGRVVTPAEPEPAPPNRNTARAGQIYDRSHRFDYPYRELIVERPDGRRVRLDAYDPEVGEIVSRKLTQLAEVEEATALGYVRELASKYQPGYVIARVPSSGPLGGRQLRGRQILEVPIQNRPVPARIIDEARRLKIIIRDVNGRAYN